MTLNIINQSSVRVPRAFIEKLVHEVQKELIKNKVKNFNAKAKTKELSIVFLNQSDARKINFKYRQKKYATDVLSFSSADPAALGELVLCPQVLKKQAKEHRHSYRDELAYMILHGILHLLGFEHEGSKKDAEKMFTLQDHIYDRLRLTILA